MREIKFRAWNKKLKIMVYEDEDNNSSDLEGCYANRVELVNDILDNIDYGIYEFMQFTGLKDKNGKEIYEGDIVKYNGFYEGDCYYNAGYGQVLWDDEDTGFYLTAKDTSFISLFDLTRNLDGEVIGNIYENPELLKEEHK